MALHDRARCPIMVFIDPRRHDNAGGIVRSAKRLVSMFTARGVEKRDVVVTIPATEAGVRAVQHLSAGNIKTNLLLVSGLMHAAVCVEAGPSAISISVQPLLEAREKRFKNTFPDLAAHPGIEDILTIFKDFKKNNPATRIIGDDFRELAELGALPGFDAVALTAKQLKDVRWRSISPTSSASLMHQLHTVASLRADQAQFPTTILADIQPGTGGFLRQLSAPARNQIFETLYPALYRMHDTMRALEVVLREELKRQLAVRMWRLAPLFELRAKIQVPQRKARRENVDRVLIEGEDYF
ncbi:hypothetical protein C8F01DRAFT_564247 [Mycena amicta]|nr:hypothetical protein C8F01DRAFT_564247 [Mycena amicta]